MAIRKGSNKAVKAKVNLPAIRITGIGGERPIVPISLHSAMEISTLIQGAAEILEADVEHLPHYLQDLKEKVIDFKQTVDKMTRASVTQSLAKKTNNKSGCTDGERL